MAGTNKTRHIKRHETCKCKCRLDASVCTNKQRWNNDKCRCECKKLTDKGVCDRGYICESVNNVNPLSATLLSCISMNNQACKVITLMLIVMSLYFILLVLKQVNVVAGTNKTRHIK